MKTRFLIGALCASLSASACSDVLSNNDGDFAFEVIPINYDPALTEGVEISVLSRAIQLDGVLVLSNGCHEITGDHRMTGTTIVFTVTARRTNFTCPDVIAMSQYRAVMLGLSQGTVYHVRVDHQVIGSAARVMAEEDVTVN